MRVADTKVVTEADVPVPAATLLNPATFPYGGSRTPHTCPRCNKESDSIGRHFVRECGHPLLTQGEASALLGAWMAGAFINPPANRGNPRLIIRGDAADLQSVNYMLGVCGRHAFDVGFDERAQLNTTPHTQLEDLRDASRADATLTQRAATVLYTLRGEQTADGIRLTGLPHADEVQDALSAHNIEAGRSDDRTLRISGGSAEAFKLWAGLTGPNPES